MQEATFRQYRIEDVFGRISDEQIREVCDFWRRQGALPRGSEPEARAREACLIARNENREIVGVCTLFTESFGNPPAPHYMYRMFVRPEDRQSGLGVEMVRLTRATLAERYRPDQPQKGLVIVTDNPMLMQPRVQELFRKWGWTHLGKAAKGQDVWRVGNENMAPMPRAPGVH